MQKKREQKASPTGPNSLSMDVQNPPSNAPAQTQNPAVAGSKSNLGRTGKPHEAKSKMICSPAKKKKTCCPARPSQKNHIPHHPWEPCFLWFKKNIRDSLAHRLWMEAAPGRKLSLEQAGGLERTTTASKATRDELGRDLFWGLTKYPRKTKVLYALAGITYLTTTRFTTDLRLW